RRHTRFSRDWSSDVCSSDLTLGWLERTPPEAIVADRAPELFRRVPVERRAVLVEAAHLGYGTLGGVAFGLLPARLRRQDWVGPRSEERRVGEGWRSWGSASE